MDFLQYCKRCFHGAPWLRRFFRQVHGKGHGICSFCLHCLELLSEYAMVVSWVQAEDWSALLDVVPSMFPMLIVYIVILVAANGLLLFAGKKDH